MSELNPNFVECLGKAIHNVGGTFLGISDVKNFLVVTTQRGAFAFHKTWGIAKFLKAYKGLL